MGFVEWPKSAKQHKLSYSRVTFENDTVSDFKLPPHWLFLEYKSAPPLGLVVADPYHAYTKQVPWQERPLKQSMFQIRLGLSYKIPLRNLKIKLFFNLIGHISLRVFVN